MVLGLGLHFYDIGEVLMSLLLSGVVILFLALLLLSGFIMWQAVARIGVLFASWNSPAQPHRPTVTASDTANG